MTTRYISFLSERYSSENHPHDALTDFSHDIDEMYLDYYYGTTGVGQSEVDDPRTCAPRGEGLSIALALTYGY
jgi:hypothetical protein